MKMVLVIDEPIDCQSCLCNDYEEGYCKAFGDGRTNVCDWNSGVIPRWCPLIPLPMRSVWKGDFSGGWNACLDTITGEKDGL